MKASLGKFRCRLSKGSHYYSIVLRVNLSDYGYTFVQLQMPDGQYSAVARSLTGEDEPPHECSEMEQFFQELVDKINS